jgi:hypothetical protein
MYLLSQGMATVRSTFSLSLEFRSASEENLITDNARYKEPVPIPGPGHNKLGQGPGKGPGQKLGQGKVKGEVERRKGLWAMGNAQGGNENGTMAFDEKHGTSGKGDGQRAMSKWP